MKQRRPGFPGGWMVSIKDRIKRSFHGILAKEKLVIDRSHPEKTIKTHHVEERQPDGSWKTVHDEHVEWEAKRRPNVRLEDSATTSGNPLKNGNDEAK